MKRVTTLLAPLLLMVAACDQDESNPPSEVSDRAGEELDEEAAPPPHEGRHGHKRMRKLDRLCDELDCTDEQREQIAAVMKGMRPEPEAREQMRAKHEAAKEKLADAFRADTFDDAVLDDLRTDMESKHAERKGKMIQAMVELHGILTPEQRAEMAEIIEKRGPMMMGHRWGGKGHHKGHKRRHKGDFAAREGGEEGRRGPDPAARAARMADRLCEKVECEGDQHDQIAAAFEGAAPKPDRDEIKAVKKSMADAFRGDTLDAATFEAAMAKLEAMKEAHHPEAAALLGEIHTILTAEQREVVAEAIEKRGPHALLGGRGPHGRHGKHHMRQKGE